MGRQTLCHAIGTFAPSEHQPPLLQGPEPQHESPAAADTRPPLLSRGQHRPVFGQKWNSTSVPWGSFKRTSAGATRLPVACPQACLPCTSLSGTEIWGGYRTCAAVVPQGDGCDRDSKTANLRLATCEGDGARGRCEGHANTNAADARAGVHARPYAYTNTRTCAQAHDDDDDSNNNDNNNNNSSSSNNDDDNDDDDDDDDAAAAADDDNNNDDNTNNSSSSNNDDDNDDNDDDDDDAAAADDDDNNNDKAEKFTGRHIRRRSHAHRAHDKYHESTKGHEAEDNTTPPPNP